LYIYIHTHTRLHIYIHIYTHTHTHTGPNSALRDVRQVWINARAYNGRLSPVTKAAEHLEALFDSTLAGVRQGSHAVAVVQVGGTRDRHEREREREREL
jgi:hypothetical protein